MKDAIVRKAGVYARVSKEDLERKKHSCSESIENQKRLAEIYVKNSEDDIEIVDYYVDDGKTGTVTDRPAYQQLLEDAKNKKINMIIVKDFSRLSRDSVDALKFIGYDIQKLEIRFVSLGEGFDSLYAQNGIDDLKMGFLAVLNSTYPADISRKVCMNLDLKRQDGKFVGAFAPYGYKKDEKNKYLLVIDEPAAKIIKKIYSMFLEGYSKQYIAVYLNENGILCPTEYTKKNQSLYQPAQKNYPFYIWTYSTIHKILSNEVYIGNLIQKKTKMIKILDENRSRKRKIPIEKGKEIKIEQTHEAIIEKELFQKVQLILKKKRKTVKGGYSVSLFSGILKCDDCKRSLYRCYSKNAKGEYIYYYRCSTYKNAPKIQCSAHTIREEILIDILQYILKLFLSIFLEEKEMYFSRQNTIETLQKTLQQQEKKYIQGRKRMLQLFSKDIITESEWTEYCNTEEEILKKIKQQLASQKKEVSNTEKLLINRILVQYFIDTIYIKEQKEIEIVFAFSNPFLL